MSGSIPRIAVVIPVHNRRQLVERAIDSVFAQDMPDFELIVVDDGSTDGSAEFVEGIGDSRLRLVRQADRRGANAARNRGISESRASLIAFLDSDDAFLPDKLSAVHSAFAADADLGTLVDSYAIVNPSRHGGEPEPLVNDVIDNSADFIAAMFTSTVKERRVRKATSGMSVRRDVALKAGLFNEKIARRQDMEFLARLAKAGKIRTTSRLLWTKFEQPDSISFAGSGFIASTILMYRAHPEYSQAARNMPADVAIYLWETLKRRRYQQLAADLKSLWIEFGISPSASLIACGAWAWYSDPRRARRKALD